MKKLTAETFAELMLEHQIRPRVRREVRFSTSVKDLDDEAWATTELLPITDRSGHRGVLLLEDTQGETHAFVYELSRGLTSATGKAQPIICDFCRTWQTGSRSGSVTLMRPGRGSASVGFLCCSDLECSRHVRSLTSAARTSRSQLREDMTPEQRIARLKERIDTIVASVAG